MQNESKVEALIVRYLANETNDQEDQVILAWINDSAENKAFFEQMQSTWLLISAQQKIAGINTGSGWTALQSKMGEQYSEQMQLQPASPLVDSATGWEVNGEDIRRSAPV